MHDPPDYEGIELRMWREYAKQVVDRLSENDEHLDKRIRTYVQRFGYDREVVENKIRTDPMFAAHFAKEPRRMKFHERAAQDWLNKVLNIEITALPTRASNAYYVSRSGVIAKLLPDERPTSKSLDFYWRWDTRDFYAMHKYTREAEGNQDSQFKEMQELLTNFLPATNPGNVLIVIVDGPYYNESKMNILRNLTRAAHPKSYAVPIQEVPSIMEDYGWDMENQNER